jgi:transposase
MIHAELSADSALLTLLKENQQLSETNHTLSEENKKLNTRVLELEERLNSNSSNSSKAPSQDLNRRSRQSQPSGKKPGGQPGHEGHSRPMVPPDKVNKIVEVNPEYCCRCGMTMSEAIVVSTECRQVVELSGVASDVTQYNIHTRKCPACKKRVKAQIPQETKRGFGPRLMAFLTMLSGEAHVTKRKICAVMGHLGIKISLGTLSNIHCLAGSLLQKPYSEIRTTVLQSANVNADESSWRLAHNRCWLWVGATPMATFFSIDPSRSQAAFQSIFNGFQNTLTTDRYAAYPSGVLPS